MAKARAIKKRMSAVKNIRTVTRTMEMVASARSRRASSLVSASRPHTDRLTDLVGDLLDRGALEETDHPLLHEPPDVKREVILIITTDRGLCGGYNNAIIRVATERRRQLTEAGYEVILWVSGRRGVSSLKFLGCEPDRTLTEFGFLPDYERVGTLAEELMGEFLAGQISGLEVAYMQYISRGHQEPAIGQILPMEFIEPPKRFVPTAGELLRYEFMPSAEEVLRNLLPATARMRLWQCFLDAGISEQTMRATAMRAATDSADDMIRELTLTHNRLRQAQITSELSEVMGGREALE